MGVNNNIYLGVGHISFDSNLGAYYQDFAPAIYHLENNSLGEFDEQGIPFLIEGDRKYYSVVYVIQYALIQHELLLRDDDIEKRKNIILTCINWLDNKAETFKDSIVWRSEENKQYNLEKGWISAMYQGQAISLYLRAGQLFNEPKYIEIAEKIFLFFQYDYSQGGALRIDKNGYKWLEEYPSNPPSYVLNGFIYSLLGILDLYRVTKNPNAKELYDNCILTLEKNIHKYDLFYWSVYDQDKKELVSYYYQKNVHIPLMAILFNLTKKDVFKTLEIKWSKQLNSKMALFLVQIMYRVQPRLRNFFR